MSTIIDSKFAFYPRAQVTVVTLAGLWSVSSRPPGESLKERRTDRESAGEPQARLAGRRQQPHALPTTLAVGTTFHVGGRHLRCVGVHARAATGAPIYEIESLCPACGRLFRAFAGRGVIQRGELPVRCLRHGRSGESGVTIHAWRAEPSRVVRRAAAEVFRELGRAKRLNVTDVTVSGR